MMKTINFLFHAIALLCIGSSTGCSSDDLAIKATEKSIAAGSWMQLSVIHHAGCSRATPTGGCMSAPNIEIEEIHVDKGLFTWGREDIERETAMLYAKSPGTEKVTVEALSGFLSGEASASFNIVDPDTILFTPDCDVKPGADGAYVLMPSASIGYTLELSTKGESIESNGYDRFVASGGEIHIGSRDEKDIYHPRYVAPEIAGPVSLTVPFDPALEVKLHIAAPSEIDFFSEKLAFDGTCDRLKLEAFPSVQGTDVCTGSVEYAVTVLTPSVCSVPSNGADNMHTGYPALSVVIDKIAIGTCQVQVDVPASGLSRVIEFQGC